MDWRVIYRIYTNDDSFDIQSATDAEYNQDLANSQGVTVQSSDFVLKIFFE